MRKIQLDGRKIKELRSAREQGSTQKEFSHEIRISEGKLRAVENDLDAVSIQTAYLIAGAVKKPLQTLVLPRLNHPFPRYNLQLFAAFFHLVRSSPGSTKQSPAWLATKRKCSILRKEIVW